MRQAAFAAALLAGAAAQAALADNVTAADYAEPTARYDHGVLGDAVEWGALVLIVRNANSAGSRRITLRLPDTRVFEDTAPRLADLDGDGAPEVIVVESDLSLGARLAVYDSDGLHAATPFIGQPYRWLAPLGAADLDGDGQVEIAYVDRPHLAAILRVWRYADASLVPVAARPGLTNHRIGENAISGGIRHCGGHPEMITANAGWSRVIASTLEGGRIISRDIAAFTGPESLSDALACR